MCTVILLTAVVLEAVKKLLSILFIVKGLCYEQTKKINFFLFRFEQKNNNLHGKFRSV